MQNKIFFQKKLKTKKNKGKDDNKNSDSDTNDIKSDDSGDDSDDQINKYRALLLGIDNKVRQLFHNGLDINMIWKTKKFQVYLPVKK